MRHTLALLLLAAATITAGAQTPPADSVRNDRIATTAYMLGAGPVRLVDSYLSQEHFQGTSITFLTITDRKPDGKAWTTKFEHQANIAFAHDRTDDAQETQAAYHFYISRLRQWHLLDGALRLQAGGTAALTIGGVLNSFGGNNPAQLRLALQLMPTLAADYTFRLFGRKTTVGYRAQLPLAGLMFSPAYGQSYYDMAYNGEYDHNVVPTTFVSCPTWRQLLTIDYNVSRRYSLRLAYLGDYHQAAVNNLRFHTYNHGIMLGIVRSCRIINYRP